GRSPPGAENRPQAGDPPEGRGQWHRHEQRGGQPGLAALHAGARRAAPQSRGHGPGTPPEQQPRRAAWWPPDAQERKRPGDLRERLAPPLPHPLSPLAPLPPVGGESLDRIAFDLNHYG